MNWLMQWWTWMDNTTSAWDYQTIFHLIISCFADISKCPRAVLTQQNEIPSFKTKIGPDRHDCSTMKTMKHNALNLHDMSAHTLSTRKVACITAGLYHFQISHLQKPTSHELRDIMIVPEMKTRLNADSKCYTLRARNQSRPDGNKVQKPLQSAARRR